MPSEVRVAKETNSPWGFQLTGGAKFGMPLTVFEVEEGGRADKAGIRLGDVLVKINGMETNELNLEQARDIINKAGNNINLAVSNLEDQEYSDSDDYHEVSKSIEESLDASESAALEQPSEKSNQTEEANSTAREDESVVIDTIDTSASQDDNEVEEKINYIAALKELEAEEELPRVDVNSLPLLPPRPAPTPELAQRKSWHPIMLDTNPPPIIEENTGNEEAPHKKLMRDIRTAIDMKKMQASPEKKKKKPKPEVKEDIVEEVAVEPEPVVSVEDQLRAMQQQLKALTRLPGVIQATLAAVTAKIDGILPAEQPISPDVVDTETSDADNDPITENSADTLDERPESTDILTEEDLSMTETTAVSEAEDAPQPEELTAEQIERNERQAKLETLNKSWGKAWTDCSKPVYKISEHFKVPYTNLISSRVKILEHKVPIKRL